MKLHLLSIAILSIFFSCKDSTEIKVGTNDYLVFGEAYGFCAGDCAHFYKINNSKLSKDNLERYTGSEPTFNNAALPEADYAKAIKLLKNFPEYLSKNPNQTIGCPDCADQGGVHLYLNRGGESQYWHVDNNIDNQPIEIREYIAQVRLIISQLR